MLLYNDNKYKIDIQNRFIINGLKKREHCICFTTKNPKQFEDELGSGGIDLDPFIKKNLVHIHKIQDISENKLNLSLQDILEQITQDVTPYFRCVGRFVENISNTTGIQAQIEIEKTIQSICNNLECGYISTYDISEIEPIKRGYWLSHLLKHHHYVIYAAEPEKSVAFETDLLNLGIN